MNTDRPILTHFHILRLHGYKNVYLDFEGSVRIVVAENGSGKTTVFNALNAVVSNRFHRLSSVPFESIEFGLSGHAESFTIRKQQTSSNEDQVSEQLRMFSEWGSVDEAEVIDFFQSTYAQGRYFDVVEHPFVHQVYLASPHDHEELEPMFDSLAEGLAMPQGEEFSKARQALREAFKNIDIVYLPTYRRIELPLLRASKRGPRAARQRLDRANRQRMGLTGLDAHSINFGLADVEATLASLTEDIERRSNFEYRAVSATMLEEILGGRVEKEVDVGAQLPDLDALSRFLFRVSKEGSADLSLRRIKTLYDSGEINSPNQLWLRYFLRRLNRVILRTQEVELNIEKFVGVCNGYLKSSSDEKELTYDRQNMKVVVKNLWTNTNMALDDLSSGEKQIVSMMAKLYLGGGRKFVIIDEPELSLSIDWQKTVLPDMLKSDSVAQMLAITHSPFVFENDLDSVAGPMKVLRMDLGFERE
jgi:predicted ATPase